MPLQLDIVTPEKRVLSETVDSVVLPGTEGEFGVLPMHVPLVTTLKPGELVYSKDGKSEHFAIGTGFVEVTGTSVAVLTDEPAYALHPVEIVGRGGSLQIRLHAAWNPSHYAVGSIRSLVEALAAFAAPVRSP